MASGFKQAWRVAVLAIGLATAGLAQAANDYFLQIDGIPGESTDKDHKDWIDIESFSWGLTLVSSGGIGKASFSDLAWTQHVDVSTPKWFLAVATGKHVKTVTLDVVKVSAGRNDSFFQMIFSDTLGSSLHISGGGGGSELFASASMTSGDTVKLRYRPQDNKGGFGAWVEGSFNLKTNSATAVFSGDETVLLGLFGSGGSVAFDAGAVTPVPEPASALLLLGGLAALAALRPRRRA
ncbi:Hcp family type VI secretion system effector [Roseateles sp. P5_E4]